MKKICVVSGTRAEFGLLRHVLSGINNSSSLSLYFVATGSHLSPEFGFTVNEIVEQGIRIDRRVEMQLSSDSSVGTAKSFGLATISFSDMLTEIQPDLLLLLGDRFEVFAAAATALFCGIPIAHIHGGEITEGAIDDAIRHSITKMADFHFVANHTCRNRVIQMGEAPSSVFVTGGLGVDVIDKCRFMSQEELERSLGLTFLNKRLIITFHPETRSPGENEQHIKELLTFLSRLKDTTLIFTKANADSEGRAINKLIESFVQDRSNAFLFSSLGSTRYLSTVKIATALIGNSSSALLESPSLGTPCINIGDRQNGRQKASCVIDCAPTAQAIEAAFHQITSKDFQNLLKTASNPYGAPGASSAIVKQLETLVIKPHRQKQFYDLSQAEK